MQERSRHLNFRQLLVRGARKINQLIIAELASRKYEDIRLAHSALLENLDQAGNSITELAERAGMTKQSMGELALDLETKGYIFREIDASDRRSRIIRFTPRGWQLMEETFVIIQELEGRIQEACGTEAFEHGREVLLAFNEKVILEGT